MAVLQVIDPQRFKAYNRRIMIFWLVRITALAAFFFKGLPWLLGQWLPVSSASRTASAVFFVFLLSLLLLYWLSGYWTVKGRTGPALAGYRFFWFLLPPKAFYSQYIEMLVNLDRFEAAERLLARVGPMLGDFYGGIVNAELCIHKQRYPEAEKHFQAACAAAKGDQARAMALLDNARLYLDYGYRIPGKLEAAEALVLQAEPMVAKNSLFAPVINGLKAMIEVRRGHYAQALAIFEESIPATVRLQWMAAQVAAFAAEQSYYAGLAEKELGNPDKARAAWDRALRLMGTPGFVNRVRAQLDALPETLAASG